MAERAWRFGVELRQSGDDSIILSKRLQIALQRREVVDLDRGSGCAGEEGRDLLKTHDVRLFRRDFVRDRLCSRGRVGRQNVIVGCCDCRDEFRGRCRRKELIKVRALINVLGHDADCYVVRLGWRRP